MNKSLFHGWKDIFSFTFKQGLNEKNFKRTTFGIAIVLFIVGMAISIIMAFVQKKDATEVSPLEVVHVIDESNLQVLYLDGFVETNKEKYPKVSFLLEESTVEEISQKLVKEAGEDGSKDAILHISESEKGYLMSLYLPEGSVLARDDGEEFLAKLKDLLKFVLPLYREEGKTVLVVAIGCTGGHHRSVAVTHALSQYISTLGFRVTENHRDMTRN
jgi:predicted RNase H-like HicB family nuclease